MRQPKSWNS